MYGFQWRWEICLCVHGWKVVIKWIDQGEKDAAVVQEPRNPTRAAKKTKQADKTAAKQTPKQTWLKTKKLVASEMSGKQKERKNGKWEN